MHYWTTKSSADVAHTRCIHSWVAFRTPSCVTNNAQSMRNVCICIICVCHCWQNRSRCSNPTPDWRRVHFIRADRTWGGKLVQRRQKGFHLLPNAVFAWKFMAAAAFYVLSAMDQKHIQQNMHARTVALTLPNGEGWYPDCNFCQVEWKEPMKFSYATLPTRSRLLFNSELSAWDLICACASRK